MVIVWFEAASICWVATFTTSNVGLIYVFFIVILSYSLLVKELLSIHNYNTLVACIYTLTIKVIVFAIILLLAANSSNASYITSLIVEVNGQLIGANSFW